MEKLKVQLTKEQLFDFLLYHTFSKASGFLVNMLGMCVIVLGAVMQFIGKIQFGQFVLYVIAGVVVLGYTPLLLRHRAKKQMEVNPEMVRIGKKLNRLSAITDYMKKNYNKELSLETLARTFGYSPTYLSRMFRKYARTNYKAYLDGIRLEHGMEQLERTDLSIGEIAVRCGFPNSKSFSRAFREKYGVLPSRFRKGD